MKSLLDTLHSNKVHISKKHTFFRDALYLMILVILVYLMILVNLVCLVNLILW